MAQGKKTDAMKKALVVDTYASCGSYMETSRKLKIPCSTVYDIIKASDPEVLAKLRNEKREEFIEQSGRIIDKGMELLEKRMAMALEKADEIDEMIDGVLYNVDLTYQEKQSRIASLTRLKIDKLTEISTVVATMWDKRALALGESTANISIGVDAANVEKLAHLAGYRKADEAVGDVTDDE